jgi:hypothetical protein
MGMEDGLRKSRKKSDFYGKARPEIGPGDARRRDAKSGFLFRALAPLDFLFGALLGVDLKIDIWCYG